MRPEAATLCFLAVTVLLLDGRIAWRKAIALIAPQVVWAYVQALPVLGLLPGGAELAGALAARSLPLPAGRRAASRRPDDEVVRMALVMLGGIVAQAATPAGVAGATYPLWLLTLIRGGVPLSF